jgi:hypothetical protein
MLRPFAYHGRINNKNARGRVVINQVAVNEVAVNRELEPAAGQRGFTVEDIFWAVGIWSVILCLSPVIVFYMLMVA